jgi:hypothetical protein
LDHIFTRIKELTDKSLFGELLADFIVGLIFAAGGDYTLS